MNHLTTKLINTTKRGKTIEYKDSDGNWQPFTSVFPDILVDIANTPSDKEIRIQPKFIGYRPYMGSVVSFDSRHGEPTVSLWREGEYCSEAELEANTAFIRWLDVKKTIQVAA